jgi:hypothetical protein
MDNDVQPRLQQYLSDEEGTPDSRGISSHDIPHILGGHEEGEDADEWRSVRTGRRNKANAYRTARTPLPPAPITYGRYQQLAANQAPLREPRVGPVVLPVEEQGEVPGVPSKLSTTPPGDGSGTHM